MKERKQIGISLTFVVLLLTCLTAATPNLSMVSTADFSEQTTLSENIKISFAVLKIQNFRIGNFASRRLRAPRLSSGDFLVSRINPFASRTDALALNAKRLPVAAPSATRQLPLRC